MIKKWKIIVLWGAATWLIFFVAVTLLMFILGSIPWMQWILEWIISAAIGFFIIRYLLKKYGGQLKEGLIYGAVLMVITLVLDLTITVPTFMQGKFLDFFSNWVMWVGIILYFIAAAVAGYLNAGEGTEENQQKPSAPQPPAPDLSQQQQ